MKVYEKIIRLILGMAVSCIAAAFLGVFLDEIFHTTPFALLILLAYAIGGNLYLMVKTFEEEENGRT